MLSTSGTASRSATQVEAVSEVTILTTKKTWGTGAALHIQCEWAWAFENALICRKRRKFASQCCYVPGWRMTKSILFSQKEGQGVPHRHSICKRVLGTTIHQLEAVGGSRVQRQLNYNNWCTGRQLNFLHHVFTINIHQSQEMAFTWDL